MERKDNNLKFEITKLFLKCRIHFGRSTWFGW